MNCTKTGVIPGGNPSEIEFWRRDDRLAGLEGILSAIRILSLDIFDTLLFRICRDPDEVFLETGRRAREQGVLAAPLTPKEFWSTRRVAMEAAYGASSREPTLDEIIQRFPPAFGDHARLIQLEMETEEDVCYLNPSMVSLIRHCRSLGIRIALVSDMYLGRTRILRLLERCGFVPEPGDQLLVSVDEQARKTGGHLFRKLLERNPDIRPGEILHIGDNAVSDIAGARREGLRALHYDLLKADEHGVFEFEDIRHGRVLPELHALRSLAGASAAGFGPGDRPWAYAAATCLGPFLAALCDWVVDTACREGAEIIAPFMREAVTFTPMLERTIRERGLPIPVVPLYVSREAVVVAGLGKVDEPFLRTFFENREYFKVTDLFRSMELGEIPEPFIPWRETFLGQAWRVNLDSGGTLLEALFAFLLEPGAQARMEAAIRRRRSALVGYLDGALGKARKVITVDIGFLGQIQRGISSALSQEGRDLEVIHLMGFAKDNSGEHLIRGMDIRAFAGGGGLHWDLIDIIHRSAPVFEQMLMGRGGSTLGYEPRGDGFQPVLDSNPMEEWEFERKDLVRLALDQFQDLWFQFRRSKPEVAARILQDQLGWCRLIHRFIDMPTPEEAATFGNLHNDVNFGSSRVVAVCPAEEEHTIRGAGVQEFRKRHRFRSPVVWPQGCVTRVDGGAIRAHYKMDRDPGDFDRMLEFSQRIARQGIRDLLIYGAGSLGRSLIQTARFAGLNVLGAVDRNEALWGTRVLGVEVMGLEKAAALGIPIYAIATYAYLDEIRQTIHSYYDGQSAVPSVFLPI